MENYLKELDNIFTHSHSVIWAHLEGYPGKKDLKKFLAEENAKINVDTFYVGIRGETVKEVHEYIKARHTFNANPNRPYWYADSSNDPSVNRSWINKLPDLLRFIPYAITHPLATFQTLRSLEEGLSLDPFGKDYSNAILEDCQHTIPCLKENTPPTAVTRPQHSDVVSEDVIAQNQMNIITDVNPEGLDQLKAFLKIVNYASLKGFTRRGDLLGISTIHFARWILIDNDKRLLFMSNYDGSWENYIGDFSDKGNKGLDTAWRSSRGYPGSKDIQAFKQYIRCRQVQSQYFYSAYRHETVLNRLNNNAMSK